jgi:threonine-phosphate decarboxylase
VQDKECDIESFVIESASFLRTGRVHGGNIYAAAERYGLDLKKIIDFSSNVNPLGSSSMARRAARRSISIIDRYPDPELTDLRRAIARYHGIKPEQVVCGNGSNGLIHVIPRVFRPRKVLIPIPTYSEYASAAQDAGCKVMPFSLKERDGFRVDPVELSFALKGVDMVFLCNPNNPTGQIVHKNEMIEIMNYVLQQGSTLVIDEAFMDFTESESMIKEAVQSSRIICLRALTKFFGMPGLRIGYAISDDATIAELREFQEPWTVNIPAECAAITALEDWGYIKKTRSLIAKERDRMLSALRLLPGVETYPGSANFILFKLVSGDADMLRQKLGYRGMLVRDCSGFPGLDSRFIRIAIRTRRENSRLIKALRELLIQ